MIKKILVALDNSKMADQVIAQAVDLARVYKAQLFAVSVINYSVLSDIDNVADAPTPLMTEVIYAWTGSLQEVLDKCRDLARENRVECFQEMLSGNPAQEIIKYADANHIDLIVMGHIGRTAATGFLMGSVSQKVASHSKKSVMIIK
ncbi:MAG: universal stress protein [Syntrophomonas sp.]|nr:universal stress protein [Syntrophomonas sp.]